MAAEQSLPFTAPMMALLNNIRRAGFPPLHQQPVEMARKAYAAGVGAMASPELKLARDEKFSIPGPAGEIPARLWAPSDDPGLPVLLYLHGGGFVVGGIATCASMCSHVAHLSGAAVVAIDYRLAPEHKFPAALDDSMAALRWLAAHGGTLGLDMTRLAVGGDSAGATLSALVAILARDEGIALRLQALFYPSVQINKRTDSFEAFSGATFLNKDLLKWFASHAGGGVLAEPWHREPLLAPSHAGLATAWIGLAQCDPLADDGKLYAQTLQAAGVEASVQVWPGVVHDFINMGRFLPEAGQAHAAMAEAMKKAFAA